MTSSIVWLPSHSTCLVAGMGNRFLRVFDTRGTCMVAVPAGEEPCVGWGHYCILAFPLPLPLLSSPLSSSPSPPPFLPLSDEHAAAQTRPTQFANHKAILGLSVCPSLPHQLASYAEVGVYNRLRHSCTTSPSLSLPPPPCPLSSHRVLLCTSGM